MPNEYQIISFYKFRALDKNALPAMKHDLRELMRSTLVYGTIILAEEGLNASVCAAPENISLFVPVAEKILLGKFEYKSSLHSASPFRKHEVKIKPEIVTLKKPVNIDMGEGTHVPPGEWNAILADPEVYLLDTRNHYEFKTGRFKGAVDPGTIKFSELPEFVDAQLDPKVHKKVAMYCTGGIRCEKFAPYLKGKGFENVYQLEGGILKYLEEIPVEEQVWEGECFVFDERVALNGKLEKGLEPDHSQRRKIS